MRDVQQPKEIWLKICFLLQPSSPIREIPKKFYFAICIARWQSYFRSCTLKTQWKDEPNVNNYFHLVVKMAKQYCFCICLFLKIVLSIHVSHTTCFYLQILQKYPRPSQNHPVWWHINPCVKVVCEHVSHTTYLLFAVSPKIPSSFPEPLLGSLWDLKHNLLYFYGGTYTGWSWKKSLTEFVCLLLVAQGLNRQSRILFAFWNRNKYGQPLYTKRFVFHIPIILCTGRHRYALRSFT